MLVDLKRYRKEFCKEKVEIFATQVIISEDFIVHEMSLFISLLRFYTCKSKIYYQSNAFRKILVHSSYFLYDIYVNV